MRDAYHIEGFKKQALETGRNRLLVTGIVLAMAFSVISARLVDLTIFQGGGEPKLANIDYSPVPPFERADIVDRNGVLLATSLPTVSLFVDPKAVINLREAVDKLITVLPDLKLNELLKKLDSNSRFIWISRNLTPKQQYNVNRLGIPGFGFQKGEKRVYPHGSLGSHILGLTDVDGRGVSGLEKYFDRPLRDGDKIEVALDIRIQEMLRHELSATIKEFRAIGAAGVVLDANSGEVISMVSLPDFDPNDPGSSNGEMAFNRVTKGVYEMGSTFKLFTAAMALDSGTVSMEGGYDASKPIRIARYTIRDFHAKNRWLSVPEIIVYSSNIGAAKMAMDVGARKQRTYLSRFGLLRPMALELPEIGRPLMPRRWREINTVTISYGHGIAVTPLQVASGVATLVNGGLYIPPTLMKRYESETVGIQRVLSSDTSKKMRTLMQMVVKNGTGRKAAVSGYAVGGKTGSADKFSEKGYLKNVSISSFVGAFPINNPKYVLLIIVDEPKGNIRTSNYSTGGWVAAPAVGKVVKGMAPLLGIAPDKKLENELILPINKQASSQTKVEIETKPGSLIIKNSQKKQVELLKKIRAALQQPRKKSDVWNMNIQEQALATY
ncbi:MAG: penicillin-binding protein 2 [Pseudomonadota bacterium]|nr:penicillin-binding protein 2 [Pseudomonadota bacterium]